MEVSSPFLSKSSSYIFENLTAVELGKEGLRTLDTRNNACQTSSCDPVWPVQGTARDLEWPDLRPEQGVGGGETSREVRSLGMHQDAWTYTPCTTRAQQSGEWAKKAFQKSWIWVQHNPDVYPRPRVQLYRLVMLTPSELPNIVNIASALEELVRDSPYREEGWAS